MVDGILIFFFFLICFSKESRAVGFDLLLHLNCPAGGQFECNSQPKHSV